MPSTVTLKNLQGSVRNNNTDKTANHNRALASHMRRRPITDLYTLAVQTCKLSRASALSSTMCPVLKHHNTCSVLSHLHVSLPTSVIDLAICSQVYYRTAMKATKKHCTRLLNPNEQPTANKCDKIVFHGCLARRCHELMFIGTR